jgi:hypothetical protein
MGRSATLAAGRSSALALLVAGTALFSVAAASCKHAASASAVDGGDEAAAAAAASQAAQEVVTEVVDAGPPRLIAALRYDTPIFNRRSFPPKTPPPVFDETTQTFRLGSLRKGTRISAKGTLVKTASCTEGWYELVSGGFICSKFATTDFDDKQLKDFPHEPFADRPLPYDYGLNLTNGAPLYFRPPLRRERAAYEKGLVVGAHGEEDRAAAAKEISGEKGEVPWYLKENLDHSSIVMDDTKGESGLVQGRMVRGFYLALDERIRAFAGKFWRTTDGKYVPVEHVLVHESKTEFEGVWVGHDNEPRKLPLGFSLKPGAREYDFPDPGGPPKREDKIPRFTIMALGDQQVVFEQRKYFETSDGWWMRDLDGTQTRPGPAPNDLGPNEKWIDVNVTTQTLVAYEGTKPVFATLVSSGRRDKTDPSKDHPSPLGDFRIREKHIATTMDDNTASDGPYSIEDVPWVMYFQKSYALHGAFWHSQFGHEHSHGCVNMTPHDARELFGWVGPTLPAGWHSVHATAANPGTRVIVHE